MTYHHGDLPEALLNAVDAIIREDGLAALTLRAVARRAGVSHGAPAHHFGDKRGLLSAYAKRSAVTLEQCVLDALAPVAIDDHVERLTQVGMGYVEFAITRPAEFQVCFRRELLDLSDEELREVRARAGQTLDQVLEAAVANGALASARLNNVRMASWSIAHGFAALAVDEAFPVSDPAIVRQIAHATFREFCEKILAET